MNRRRSASLISAGLILGASLFSGAVPAAAKGHLDVLLDGLSSPKGIVAGPKSVFISQGAFGPPGPVLEYLLTGPARGTTNATTDPLNLIDITGTPDGAGWGIGGDGVLYRQATAGGTIEPVLNFHAYQAGDPDPTTRHPRTTRRCPSRTRARPTRSA